jgi:hypothetical protein
MAHVLGFSRYWLRVTFRRRWASYLGLVLIIGLIGGVALGSIAGARRTQSSYPIFLSITNPSDISVSANSQGPQTASGATPPNFAPAISKLPDVTRVVSVEAPEFLPLAKNGARG